LSIKDKFEINPNTGLITTKTALTGKSKLSMP
jgi:hypothetical protein